MKKGSMQVLSQEEKYMIINEFIKELIEEKIINIFREDNSVNEDLLYKIDEKQSVFESIEFIKA